MIWDSMDAQTIKGKPVSGTPSPGSGLIYDGTAWRTGEPAGDVVRLHEEFLAGNNTSGQIGALGWVLNGVGTPSAGRAVSSGVPGIYDLSASAASNDRSILSLPGDIGRPFGSASEFRDHSFDVVFALDAANCANATNHFAWAGLCDVNQSPPGGATGAVAPRGFVIRKALASSNWVAECNDGTTTSATLLAVSAAQVAFRIRRVGAGVGFRAAATLAGLAAATEAVITANLFTNYVIPAFCVGHDNASTNSMRVDFMSGLLWNFRSGLR